MTELESLARYLCTKAGGNPDRMEPVTVIAGDPTATGAARRGISEHRPHWLDYANRARDMLGFEEWRAAQTELPDTKFAWWPADDIPLGGREDR